MHNNVGERGKRGQRGSVVVSDDNCLSHGSSETGRTLPSSLSIPRGSVESSTAGAGVGDDIIPMISPKDGGIFHNLVT